MEKKPILDIMIDLETASIKDNAALISWTMLPFSPQCKEVEDTYFHKVISLTSCFFAGMDIDSKTQQWWISQDPLARAQFLEEENVSIGQAANEAYEWLSNLGEKYDLCLWSRGIDFDIPKIIWCFKTFVDDNEENLPFKYYNKMDVRTILKWMDIHSSDYEFKGIKHCSFDDCMHDAKLIQEAYKKLHGLVNDSAYGHELETQMDNFGGFLKSNGANTLQQEMEADGEILKPDDKGMVALPNIQLITHRAYYHEAPNTLSWNDLMKIEDEISLCTSVIKTQKDRISKLERSILEEHSR